MSIPKTMRALVQQEGESRSVKVQDVPVPKLEKNEVLVKVDYVAQNPTDWKHRDFISSPNVIHGNDYAGTVVQLGSDLTVPLKVGDKVAAVVHGGMYEDRGAYAQYARVESDLTFKIPEGIKGEEAATYGIAWGTAALALIKSQGQEFPPAKVSGNPWYVIYAASTSVGLFAIPLAKAMGYKVLGLASPHSFDLVKSYGADQVIDYHDVDKAIQQGLEITGGGVQYALDTISEGDSFKITLGIMGEKGKKLTVLLPPSDEVKKGTKVEIDQILMYTFHGREFKFGPMGTVPAVPEDRAFAVELYKRTPDLIKEFGIKSNPIKLRGGLDDIVDGYEEMKAGKVSGYKLVYKID